MRVDRISAGDIVKASIKGRTVYGEVREVAGGVVHFLPLTHAAGWRHATAMRSLVTVERLAVLTPATTASLPRHHASSSLRRASTDKTHGCVGGRLLPRVKALAKVTAVTVDGCHCAAYADPMHPDACRAVAIRPQRARDGRRPRLLLTQAKRALACCLPRGVGLGGTAGTCAPSTTRGISARRAKHLIFVLRRYALSSARCGDGPAANLCAFRAREMRVELL